MKSVFIHITWYTGFKKLHNILGIFTMSLASKGIIQNVMYFFTSTFFSKQMNMISFFSFLIQSLIFHLDSSNIPIVDLFQGRNTCFGTRVK